MTGRREDRERQGVGKRLCVLGVGTAQGEQRGGLRGLVLGEGAGAEYKRVRGGRSKGQEPGVGAGNQSSVLASPALSSGGSGMEYGMWVGGQQDGGRSGGVALGESAGGQSTVLASPALCSAEQLETGAVTAGETTAAVDRRRSSRQKIREGRQAWDTG
jgi:hypothetical protein